MSLLGRVLARGQSRRNKRGDHGDSDMAAERAARRRLRTRPPDHARSSRTTDRTRHVRQNRKAQDVHPGPEHRRDSEGREDQSREDGEGRVYRADRSDQRDRQARVARLVPAGADAAIRPLARISQWLKDRNRGMCAEPVGEIDPTLPATAQVVAVQHPISSVSERPYDLGLIAAVLALLAIGTIAIFSSTAADGLAHHRNPWYALERQLAFLVIGAFAMWLGASIDYRRLKRMVYPLLIITFLLLVATLFMSPLNGARRWIPLGLFSLQPVELAKLALVAYLALSLSRRSDQIKLFTTGFVPYLVVCSAIAMLLLVQPDLGSALVLTVTTLGVLFVAGARLSYIALTLLTAAPIVYQLIVGTPWRLQRVNAFFNPEAYATAEGYQFLQARTAMGSGGVWGTGLGAGYQSLGYTPEAESDFILAPIGEELGFVGVCLVFALFLVVIWRGLRAALGARDVFGGYLALGITILIGSQALFNIGVVLGFVPNKGIPLPLVSAGGSSLIVMMFLVGLVLNVGRRQELGAEPTAVRGVVRRRRARVRVVIA